jgi:hypothetical protein
MESNIATLSQMVDAYIEMREQRLSMDRAAAELKEQESELKAALMTALAENKASAVGGRTHRVTLKNKDVPTVTNWPALYDYITHNDAFDLLQKRLSGPAVEERWKDGVNIDGVGTVSVLELSVNKL